MICRVSQRQCGVRRQRVVVLRTSLSSLPHYFHLSNMAVTKQASDASIEKGMDVMNGGTADLNALEAPVTARAVFSCIMASFGGFFFGCASSLATAAATKLTGLPFRYDAG